MFTAKRVTRTHTQHILAEPARVFPMLCPVMEKEWAVGWDYQMVYSESGVAEPGCIFTTAHPGEPETVWAITRYDKTRFEIEFTNFRPGITVCFIQISLDEAPDQTTLAHISYTFTSLSEKGNAFITHFTEAHYKQMMIDWEEELNHYLATGQQLVR